MDKFDFDNIIAGVLFLLAIAAHIFWHSTETQEIIGFIMAIYFKLSSIRRVIQEG